MDCDTARLFLQFSSPTSNELDGDEANELHAHLEQCSACNALAMNTRRLDQHLGRAMNAVEVPVGLNARLKVRLAQDRGAFHRRWLRTAGYIAAAACLLLLLGWGYLWYDAMKRTQIHGDYVVSGLSVSPLPAGAPRFVNYGFLTGTTSEATLPGHKRKVPQLIFVNDPIVPVKGAKPKAPVKPQKAIIYILDGKDNVTPAVGGGYEYNLDVVKDQADDGKQYKYLILYNGDNWDWLRLQD